MSHQSERVARLLQETLGEQPLPNQEPRFAVTTDITEGATQGELRAELSLDKIKEMAGGDGGIDSPAFHRELLEMAGLPPEEYRVVEGRMRTSAWQQREDGEHLHAYKFEVERIHPTAAWMLEDIQLMQRIYEDAVKDPLPRRMGEEHTFVFQVGDLQLGKADGGGVEHVVGVFTEKLASAVAAYREIAAIRNVAAVQVCMPGDCIEGNVSQGGRNQGHKNLSLGITEQVRLLHRLMILAVSEFGKLAPHVYLDVVNGNHDESQRTPVSTSPGDGWATAAAEMVRVGIEQMAPAGWDHIEVRVPADNRSFMVRDLPGGSTVIVAHGHQWRGGQHKCMDWWSNQSFHHNVPSAGVLQFGHFHHPMLLADGLRHAICSDTLESESSYWVNQNGGRSANLGTTYLLRENIASFYTHH